MSKKVYLKKVDKRTYWNCADKDNKSCYFIVKPCDKYQGICMKGRVIFRKVKLKVYLKKIPASETYVCRSKKGEKCHFYYGSCRKYAEICMNERIVFSEIKMER